MHSFAQEDWTDNYRSISFADLLDTCSTTIPNDSVDCSKVCYNYCGLFDLKFKVEFEYLKSTTTANDTRKTYIDQWFKGYWQDKPNDMFIHEILFSNNGEKRWFFVQEPTLKYYNEELKKGDKVYLYLMFVGTLVVENKTEYMFVVNEFQAK